MRWTKKPIRSSMMVVVEEIDDGDDDREGLATDRSYAGSCRCSQVVGWLAGWLGACVSAETDKA